MVNLKIDWNLLATLGVAAIGGLAAAIILPRLGMFAYNGLSTSKIYDVYNEFDKECKIMTRATGRNWIGEDFTRGLYSCNGNIYYYRLDKDITGRTSFLIYPLVMEYFTDGFDFGGSTGELIHP